MLNSEQDVYKKPRRVYTIRTAHGFTREALEKRIGEVIPLVPDIYDPAHANRAIAGLKRKLMQSRPDDVLAAGATTNECPLLIEAALLLHKLHGHVNYIYYEPVWGTTVEGRAE